MGRRPQRSKEQQKTKLENETLKRMVEVEIEKEENKA